MNLLHVFDGRTDADQYYWFVLTELDNADELILTMPKARISAEIEAKFEVIKAAYQTERQANPNSSAELAAKAVGDRLGYKHWTTVDRNPPPS